MKIKAIINDNTVIVKNEDFGIISILMHYGIFKIEELRTYTAISFYINNDCVGINTIFVNEYEIV